MIKEHSSASGVKIYIVQNEYKFHVVHLVEKMTDDAIYIDRIDDKDKKEALYLFEYLNKKGREGWRYSYESGHKSVKTSKRCSNSYSEK